MSTASEVGRGEPRRTHLGAIRAALPRGGVLSERSFAVRHRGICVLLWAHVVGLAVIAVVRTSSVIHPLLDVGVVAICALAASLPTLDRSSRSAAATLGLLSSSAVLIHTFDGAIEAHFHFFVTIAVVALYQSWLPYLIGVGFVLLHHVVLGNLAPAAVYDHPAAVRHPGWFALIHGGFILAESLACLVYWRVTEDAIDAERRARHELMQAHDDLAKAQAVSGVGSWEWDVPSDNVTWSDQTYTMAGRERATFTPTLESYGALIHLDDRERINDRFAAARSSRAPFDEELRMVRADGSIRDMHALGEWVVDPDGTLRRFLGTAHDVTERNRLQAEIEHMAFHDALTGLANRRLFLDRLQRALAEDARGGGASAVLFLDLDGFKSINDTFGHQAGDDALCEVARRIRAATRGADTVARLGGDEFAVLCEGADLPTVAAVAERIEAQLLLPYTIGDTTVALRGSIGITVSTWRTSAEELLRAADAAMYAKKHGAATSSRRAAVASTSPP